MLDLLQTLSAWLTGFATSEWAVVILVIASFSESIFFPIPPDPLLIAIGVLQPHLAIWFGALVTVSSVTGALVGHWVGKRFGRPLLLRFFSKDMVMNLEKIFQRYGMWAILLGAFTPLPYKLFAIGAGVLEMDRRTFILASVIGRGARFMALGVLIFIFRDSINGFISENFEMFTLLIAGATTAAVITWALIHRKGRVRSNQTGGPKSTNRSSG